MNDYEKFVRAPGRRVAIVAHRGGWHKAPENSIEALENAISLGCEIVETDVQCSADGVLFHLHDKTLERMTLDRSVAQDLSMTQLQQLNLRQGMGGECAPFSEFKIPTLDSFLETAKGRIFIDLDIKYPHLLQETARCVIRHSMQKQVNFKAPVHSIKDVEMLQELKLAFGVVVMPKIRFVRGDFERLFELMAKLCPAMVEAKFDELSTLAALSMKFKEANVSVWVNTLNEVACCGLNDDLAVVQPDAVWGRLFNAGVSIIQTDEPEALTTYIEQPIRAVK